MRNEKKGGFGDLLLREYQEGKDRKCFIGAGHSAVASIKSFHYKV